MKIYSVKYFAGGEHSKYVGSIDTYKDGGTDDVTPMSKEDAEQLLSDLNEYVRNLEYIGRNDLENEQAHEAFEKGEWGFAIESIEIPYE